VFDQVVIRVADWAESERFYRAVLPALGRGGEIVDVAVGQRRALQFGDLVVAEATDEHPPTTHLHVGLAAASHEAARAFWRAGTAAGFRSDGEPGPREQYSPEYFGAFLLDPAGNSVEAALHENVRASGAIDHLWIRVTNARAHQRFYEATRAQTDFGLVASADGLARFRGPAGGSFTVIDGPEPTTGLDMTIGAARFTDADGRSLKLTAA
jgi:catechol 2,3-dioxygenase-like lactoylglutathione lyase family enzyme